MLPDRLQRFEFKKQSLIYCLLRLTVHILQVFYLYDSFCPSVGWSVGLLVRRSAIKILNVTLPCTLKDLYVYCYFANSFYFFNFDKYHGKGFKTGLARPFSGRVASKKLISAPPISTFGLDIKISDTILGLSNPSIIRI